MEVSIEAVNFTISEKLTAFIQKKAERLARHNVNITEFDAKLRVVKPETIMNKEVVIRVSMPQVAPMVSTKVADSFEEAVDASIDAIDRQIERRTSQK